MPARPSTSSSHKKRKMATLTDLDAIAAPANGCLQTNKYNLKYEPADPSLTEEQAAEWRKEQRKARNRASAAQSRHKTKAKIDELEGEVGELKRMYAAAVARIAELEGGSGMSGATSMPYFAATADRVTSTTISPPSSPSPPRMDAIPMDAADIPMPPLDAFPVHDSTSISTLTTSDLDHDLQDHDDDAAAAATEKQHVIETTSLPAVKITGAASHHPPQPRNVVVPQDQGQGQHSSSSSSYGPYTYGGMSPDSSDAISRALDGHVSLDSSLSSASSSLSSPDPSSPSLASTSSSSDASFLPSDLEEDENEELEEFLLDAFQGFEATEISAI